MMVLCTCTLSILPSSPALALVVYLNDGGAIWDNQAGDLNSAQGTIEFSSQFTLYPYAPDPMVQMYITIGGKLSETDLNGGKSLSLSNFVYTLKKTGPDFEWPFGYIGPWPHGISFYSTPIDGLIGPIGAYASYSGIVSFTGPDTADLGIVPVFGNLPIGSGHHYLVPPGTFTIQNAVSQSWDALFLNPTIGGVIGFTVPYASEIQLSSGSSFNVSAVVVPAPSALLLLVSGLAGVVGLRRKRLLK